jgi:hypothetical protein
MTLFLPESRHLADEAGIGRPTFPADVLHTIALAPEDAFGAQGTALRSVLRFGSTARHSANFNDGTSSVEGDLIESLQFDKDFGALHLTLTGNQLFLSHSAKSIADVFAVAQPASLSIPALLTLRVGVFVWIKQFAIRIGDKEFNFRVGYIPGSFLVESRETMTQKVIAGLEDWFTLTHGHERLFSSTHYFRQALRLWRQPDHVALVAEIILNLTKALEILLTPQRDVARERAASWGFTNEQIEQWIIPLYLLRNQMDVAHSSFGPLNPDERTLVIDFTSQAIKHVGELIAHVRNGVTHGNIALEPVTGALDIERRRLLAALAEYAQPKAAGEANAAELSHGSSAGDRESMGELGEGG